MIDKMIRCKRCKRTYPEDLGRCEFCAEMEMEAQDARANIDMDDPDLEVEE